MSSNNLQLWCSVINVKKKIYYFTKKKTTKSVKQIALDKPEKITITY